MTLFCQSENVNSALGLGLELELGLAEIRFQSIAFRASVVDLYLCDAKKCSCLS